MRYPHLKKLDLHLLYYLAVLLEERRITRAPQRCFLSQPAMSRQLERLRAALDDDLLVRDKRTYQRTPRGERLLRDLEPLLPKLEGVLKGQSFDPASSEDRFQVAMTDYACTVFLPELARRFAEAAPNAFLDVVPWTEHCFEQLRRGTLETVITVAGVDTQQIFRREVIFSDKFVCVVAKRHPLNVQRVTLAQYLKYRHAVVAVIAGQQTLVDRPLGDLSMKSPRRTEAALLRPGGRGHCGHRPDPYRAAKDSVTSGPRISHAYYGSPDRNQGLPL